MPPRKAELLPQVPYNENNCLNCGRSATLFSSVEVPEVLDYLAHRITLEKLEEIARDRIKWRGCLFAPRSGIAICAHAAKAVRP